MDLLTVSEDATDTTSRRVTEEPPEGADGHGLRSLPMAAWVTNGWLNPSVAYGLAKN